MKNRANRHALAERNAVDHDAPASGVRAGRRAQRVFTVAYLESGASNSRR